MMPTRQNGAVPWYRSIRFRLVAAAIAVELCMLGILLANSYRLVNDALESQTRARLEALAPLLNASLAGYVFQRDHSEIKAILNDLVESRFTEIRYIVVLDSQNRLISSVGAHVPLDQLEKSEDHSVREALSDRVYDAHVPLTLPGNRLGSVRFGLSLLGMVSLRDTVLQQSLAIAALEVVLSLLLLTSGGYLITRHISTLLDVTRRVARGDYGAHIDIGGKDEIGLLANNFNCMSDAVQNRMDALQASEAALRESETRFRAIFDNVSDAIFVHTIDSGKVVDVNRRMVEMYGFSSREEALACDLMQISADTPPYSAVEAQAHMHMAIEHGPQTFEWLARNKQGKLFWVEASLRLSHIGETPHLLAVVRDISERKAMEAELLAHRDHLEELVADRTAELARARQEAEQLAHVKSEFLANMSHEIRTPLNAVIGLARIGARDSMRQNSNHATFERILDSSQHLLGVINDILDISKIEAGKLHIETHPFALRTMIQGALSFVSAQAESKGLALEVSLAPGLPEWVLGDAHRIAQILTNLLSNAVKFTEQGEVRVRVGADQEYTYFKVVDTGIGLSTDQQKQLFQPFEQADASTTRRFGGTGLGLAISQNLAHLMGGDISVDSLIGAGSGFVLRLPLPATQKPDNAETFAQSPAGTRQLIGLRILAAEDIEVNRLILEDILSEEGIQVIFAENGLQALERVEQCKGVAFDAVLMDIQMPVMDGFEATRRIHAIAPDLPVIGLTAHALAEERQRCLDAGMVDHVTKPIDPLHLFAALAKWPRRNAPRTETPLPAQASSPVSSDSDNALKARLATLPWLDLKQGLAITRGRITNYARLLHKYAEHQAQGIDTLAERLAHSTPQEVQRFAHSLKGSSGSLGVTGVHHLALELETALREGSEAGELIRQFSAELGRVVTALLAVIPPEADTPSSVVDHEAVQRTLRELENLLAESNASAASRFNQAAPQLLAGLGDAAHELEHLIGDFQYPEALALVRTLLKQY